VLNVAWKTLYRFLNTNTTFARYDCKDHFNIMAKKYGVSPRSYLTKSFDDQKSLIINLYPTFLGKTKMDIWTKEDVRACRPDEPMYFTSLQERVPPVLGRNPEGHNPEKK
jgi:hypothetical protein